MNIQMIALILGLGVLGGLGYSAPAIIKIIRIRRMPTTWMSSLPKKGPVEVVGVVGQKTILSPFNIVFFIEKVVTLV